MPKPDGRKPDVTRHLPLKVQWFHILMALSEEPRHGSGIVRTVLGQTDGKLRLWPAALYGSLEELVGLGWIDELTKDDDFPEGESRRKRIYRLTPTGAEVLAAEAGRLGRLVRVVTDRLAARAVP